MYVYLELRYLFDVVEKMNAEKIEAIRSLLCLKVCVCVCVCMCV